MSEAAMRRYLGRSLASNRKNGVLNQNKLNGLLAEVEFRRHLVDLGFADRISVGGWIARRVGKGEFGRKTLALFPEIVDGRELTSGRTRPEPGRGLHTICSTFHQIGIESFFCTPRINTENDPMGLEWDVVQLGTPITHSFEKLSNAAARYLPPRGRAYNFLTYKTDASRIPEQYVSEEFLKEHLRVSLQSAWMSELSDVDGIFWGERFTYPLEIKEKTAADDRHMGKFFGIDVGPFVKLAFYAARRGNLNSIFVVREIQDTTSRELEAWWFITFELLAQYASWNPLGGGINMRGGGSTVIRIPKDQFRPITRGELAAL